MTVASDLRSYPFEPFTGDLPAELLDMVATEPVSRVRLTDGRPCWLVLGYAECCTVLSDPRFGREHIGRPQARVSGTRDISMDGPAHAAVRRVASRAFTARRIEGYRSLVQRHVDELIDAMVAGPQPADLVSALVAPLPLRVVCEVTGVPAADWEMFYGWLAGINSIVAFGSSDAVAARSELDAYLAELVTVKRANPGNDLLSVWAAGGDHDLTDAELVELAVGLLLGGIEVNTTSAGIRALFQHPDQLDKLRAAPEKMSAAADEILRFTAVSAMTRVQVVATDTEFGGFAMRAGEYIMPLGVAGNRDPRVFHDPNVFDIDRVQAGPTLAFGHGPHVCLGSALGKLQVELATGALLQRMPGLRPAVPLDELPWRHDRLNCGLKSFPVVW
jgi:cytochrome P450